MGGGRLVRSLNKYLTVMVIDVNGFYIGERLIPIYGIMYIVGFAAAVLTAIPKARKMKISATNVTCAGVFAGVFGLIGSKLTSILTSIDLIIKYHLSFYEIMANGFVFYGGLIGGMLGLFVYTKAFHLPTAQYFDLFAAGAALGHAFGRIGCLFSGCCYGQPTTGNFYVIYTRTVDPNTPLGVKLLPMPLIEIFCLVTIYIICEIVFYRGKKQGASAIVYVMTYAVARFILEFFRGDAIRGIWGGLSTSQYISFGLLVLCLSLLEYLVLRRNKRQHALAAAPSEAEPLADAPLEAEVLSATDEPLASADVSANAEPSSDADAPASNEPSSDADASANGESLPPTEPPTSG